MWVALLLACPSIPAPQDAKPSPPLAQEVVRLREEMERLRGEMRERDRAIEALRREVEALRAERGEATASLEAEIARALEALPREEPAGTVRAPLLRGLTLGGELRTRYESRIDFGFGADDSDDDDFVQQRSRLHADADVAEGVRAFLQFQDIRLWGEEKSTVEASADSFDLHQGFLDLGDPKGGDLRLRVGRQELAYGDQRLVGNFDWAVQARSFDGLRADRVFGPARASAFAVRLRESPFDGEANDAEFYGLYGTVDPLEGSTVDAYAFWLDDDGNAPPPATFAAAPRQRRGTVGTRVATKVENLDAKAEGALQWGKEGDADIPFGRVFAVYALAGYTFAEVPGRPRFGVEWDSGTGDDDPTDDDAERFNNLFPTNHAYYGFMDFASWSNLEALRLSLSGKPAEKATLSFDWHFLRSNHAADPFGGSNVTFPGNPGGSNAIGQELDAYAAYALTERLDFLGGYSVFFPGRRVEETLGNEAAHFLYAQARLRF